MATASIRYKDGSLLAPGSLAHKLATEGKHKELYAHMKDVDARYAALVGDQNWRIVVEHGMARFLHKTKPLWVLRYPCGGQNGQPFWQAYRAEFVGGRTDEKPWCQPNRRIGAEHVGFPTMEAAMQAAERWWAESKSRG